MSEILDLSEEDIDLLITPDIPLPSEISEIIDILVEEFEMIWRSIRIAH